MVNGVRAAAGEEFSTAEVRVSDWLMEALYGARLRHVFFVPGGGAMHLNDAAGGHQGLVTVSTLHEQAAAIAAEAYAKTCGVPGICLVTSGPGATNALTGVAGAWVDSTPMIVLSGQAKRDDLIGSTGVRQRGLQEIDIVSIVRSITKYAVQVLDPTTVRYHVERAVYLATHGRPGPVWLDIPVDVQAAQVVPDDLKGFDPSELGPPATLDASAVDRTAETVVSMLRSARRPIVYVGAGVRLSGAEDRVRRLVERLEVPVLCTWPARGIIGDDHPLFVGSPGPLAPRGANFALQNADLFLGLGTRLDLGTTGYDPKGFGRNARKIVVDIDPAELGKLEGAIDLSICADVGLVTDALLREVEGSPPLEVDDWRDHCRRWRERYPVVLPEHRVRSSLISTYHFADVLSGLVADDDVLAPCSSGLAIEIFLLAMRLRTGQREIFNPAWGAMGYGPPVAIGACLGSGGRRTVAVDGDGGLQLNAQELETIRRLDLPVKLFVLSNDGYASIRASQTRWFGRRVGADAASGLTLPPLEALATAYGLPFTRLDGTQDLASQVRAVLQSDGPIVCDVPTPPDEPRGPGMVSEALPTGRMLSRPIEDLAPLLPRDEFAENMAPSSLT